MSAEADAERSARERWERISQDRRWGQQFLDFVHGVDIPPEDRPSFSRSLSNRAQLIPISDNDFNRAAMQILDSGLKYRNNRLIALGVGMRIAGVILNHL